MDAIETVLGRSDLESIGTMTPNERYADGIADGAELAFEKVGPSHLSVALLRIQDGNSVRNSSIVFRIDRDTWIPIEYRRDPHTRRYDAYGLYVTAIRRRWNVRIRCPGLFDDEPERSLGP